MNRKTLKLLLAIAFVLSAINPTRIFAEETVTPETTDGG